MYKNYKVQYEFNYLATFQFILNIFIQICQCPKLQIIRKGLTHILCVFVIFCLFFYNSNKLGIRAQLFNKP